MTPTARQNIILIVACTAVLFEAMDIAIINLAIPLIQKQFVLDNDKALWLQTLYILPYGGFLIVGGKLADVIGRKKIFMTGSALFLLTSLGAGLSFQFEMLTACRLIQGVAAALVLPSALSIITNTFTENAARSKAIGIFSSFAAIGSGLGLSLGGIISTYAGWPWAFFINVPTIGASLILGYIFIDRDQTTGATSTPDIFSSLLLTMVIMIASYFVHDFNQVDEYPILFSLLAVMALASFLLFIYRNKLLKEPLIDFSLFRNRATLTANLGTLMMGAFFTSYLFMISLLLQNNMNFSAARAGILLFPFSMLSALTGKFLFPRLLNRYSIPQIALFGMLLMMTGGFTLIASVYLNYYLPVLLLSVGCVTGVGIAILFPSLTVMAVNEIPAGQHGLASSMSSTAHFFGGGLGLSVLGLFMQVSGSTYQVGLLPVAVLFSIACVGVVILSAARVVDLSAAR